ncbi:MAG: TolC family protein, partial [Pseudomonadota bacterium]
VGPQLAWSISNLLRARQRTDAAVANTDMAFAMYEQTVLDALAETESALVRQARLQQRKARLTAAAEAAGQAAALARVRYEAGATDFLNVLDAERVRLQSTTLLAAVRTEIARSQVSVFRVLRAGVPPMR